MARLITRLGLLFTLAVTLAGFWLLLGRNYSGETYHANLIDPGTVELTWFGMALVVAVVAMVVNSRQDELPRSRLLATLPMAAAAAIVVGQQLIAIPVNCGNAMLFAVGCGWSTYLLGRDHWSLSHKSEAWGGPVVWSVTVGLAVYFVWQQSGYLNNLTLGFADCGFPARQMQNTLHHPQELFLRVNPDRPLFWDHFEPGVLPFVIGWAVWPNIKLTIIYQVAAVLGVTVPLYWIGKRAFGNRTEALLLSVGWLVFPSTSQMIFRDTYGFQWGVFSFLLYFVALALWLHGRNGWAIVAIVWAVLIKEEAAILVGMFGLYLLIFEQRRRAGATLAAVGFGYFLLVAQVIMPALHRHGYVMVGYYAHLGGNLWEIALSPLTKPAVFWGQLAQPTTFYFLGALLVPLLFLPLRRPALLFIALPTFVFICLLKSPHVKSICFEYQAGLLPILFWALVRTLTDWPVARRGAALTGVIVAGATLSIFLGNNVWSKDALSLRPTPGRLAIARRVGAEIHPDATLVTTMRLATHHITQKSLYVAPQLPPETDYVLLDLREQWRAMAGLDWLRERRDFQRQVEARTDLPLVAEEDGLLLYARGGRPLDIHSRVETNALPAGLHTIDTRLGHGLHAVGYSLATSGGEGRDRMARAHVRVWFGIDSVTDMDMAVRCELRLTDSTGGTESYVSEFQPLGQGILPIDRWVRGKFYAEDFLMGVPAEFTSAPLRVELAVQQLDGTTPAQN